MKFHETSNQKVNHINSAASNGNSLAHFVCVLNRFDNLKSPIDYFD